MKKIAVRTKSMVQLEGKPDTRVNRVTPSPVITLSPSRIGFIKPKLQVKEGDTVLLGSKLFYDKKNEYAQYVSPAGGVIQSIQYGERRSIQNISIKRDKKEASDSFKRYKEADLAGLTYDELVAVISQSGLWPCIKSLPFRAIANPQAKPKSIIIAIGDNEPFLPDVSVVLKNRDHYFRHGLLALKQLCKTCHVVTHEDDAFSRHMFSDIITATVSGEYPALDPAVILYHYRQTPEDNNAWYLNYQDVIRLGELLLVGAYPADHIISVGGSLVDKPQHYKVRQGTSLKHIVPKLPEGVYLAGGVYTGHSIHSESAINYGDYAVHVLPEKREREMFHFFKPGLDKASYFRTFLSAILPQKPVALSTSLNGGYRACISCGECPNVCPVGLLPQFIAKALHYNDTETAVKLGLLDCAECGLCSTICPSKIELVDMFKQAKKRVYEESKA